MIVDQKKLVSSTAKMMIMTMAMTMTMTRTSDQVIMSTFGSQWDSLEFSHIKSMELSFPPIKMILKLLLFITKIIGMEIRRKATTLVAEM